MISEQEQLGRPETLLADGGYFSEANVMACTTANIEPLLATRRQPHHPFWRERFAAPPSAPANSTPVETMAWRLQTPQGKQLYGLRKQTPEPVFGIIKSVMGFHQFLLRGLDCVLGEWTVVSVALALPRSHRHPRRYRRWPGTTKRRHTMGGCGEVRDIDRVRRVHTGRADLRGTDHHGRAFRVDCFCI
jgi:Transposase DDE domain